MGIEGVSRKTGAKGASSSKGGSIGKKEREVLSLTKGGASMADMSVAEAGMVAPNKNVTGGLKEKEKKKTK
jgi:hypothetical protein